MFAGQLIFISQGELPYGCIPNSEVAKTIASAVLLERPQTCSSEM